MPHTVVSLMALAKNMRDAWHNLRDLEIHGDAGYALRERERTYERTSNALESALREALAPEPTFAESFADWAKSNPPAPLTTDEHIKAAGRVLNECAISQELNDLFTSDLRLLAHTVLAAAKG